MVETPLIRHGFAVPPSPLWGEGSRSTQIGWNCSHCGTFGYIYWELGQSAPFGRRAARCAALQERLREPAHSSAPFWGHLPPGGRHDGRAGEDTRPYGDCGRKTAGAQCAPLRHNYKRLYIQEKGQVWNLSLNTQRRNAVLHKISLVPFFFKERNCSIPSRCPSSGPPGGRGGRPQTGCSEIRLQCARPCWDR